MNSYGKEVVLDLHNCSIEKFNKDGLQTYFDDLCDLIDMEQVQVHWWDIDDLPEEEKYTEDHLIGISAVQFIKTSDIVIHTLEVMKRVYLNIFSCKDFDPEIVRDFSKEYFNGDVVQYVVLDRI